MATVKVSKNAYEKLNELAGKLRSKYGRPVSIAEALEYAMKEKHLRPADFAGSWSMTDEEEARIMKSMKEAWTRWKL